LSLEFLLPLMKMPQTANIRDCSAVAQSSGNRSRHSGDPNLVKLQPVACASLYPWYGTATCARGHCVASPLAASKDGKKKNPCQYCTDVKLDTTHNIHTPKTMCKNENHGQRCRFVCVVPAEKFILQLVRDWGRERGVLFHRFTPKG